MSHIDKQATIDAIRQKAKAELADVNHYVLEGVHLAVDVVEGMPEVDVPDRKVGTWVGINKIEYLGGIIEPTAFECSICGNRINNKFMAKLGRCVFKYCSTCGAEMRNEEDELHDTALDDHPGDVV